MSNQRQASSMDSGVAKLAIPGPSGSTSPSEDSSDHGYVLCVSWER